MHGCVSSTFPSAVTGRATRWIDGLPCSATAAMNSSCRVKTRNLLAVRSVESYLDRVPGFESQCSAHRRRQHHAHHVLFFGAQAAYLCPRRLRHHLVGLQRDCLHPVFVRHEQTGRPLEMPPCCASRERHPRFGVMWSIDRDKSLWRAYGTMMDSGAGWKERNCREDWGRLTGTASRVRRRLPGC